MVSRFCQNSLLGKADRLLGLSISFCQMKVFGLYQCLSTLAAQEKSLGEIFSPKYQHGGPSSCVAESHSTM